MPIAETAHFGMVEYAEETVLEFPAGLPAFETENRFIALRDDRYEPLLFLQSLNTARLAFLAIAIRDVVLNYNLELSDEDLTLLKSEPAPENLEALALVTVAASGEVTVNLQAPVVVHHGSRRGFQVIQTGSNYSTHHPLGTGPAGGGLECS